MRKIRQYLHWILLTSFLLSSIEVSAQCSSCGFANQVPATVSPITAVDAAALPGPVAPVPGTVATVGSAPGVIAPATSTYEAAARPITGDYAVHCPPCGFVRTLPGPGYDHHGVLPYEAYLATTTGICRGVLEGFYFGFGAGGGSIDYDLEVNTFHPLLIEGRNDKSYLLLRGQVGFAFVFSRFYLALEGGYNYRSLTRSTVFDPVGSITFTEPAVVTVGPPFADPPVIVDILLDITVQPCDVHLDVNAQNAGTIDLLPGFVITPNFVLYGRVGAEFSRYRFLRHVCIPDIVILDPIIIPPIIPPLDNPDIVISNTEFRNSIRRDEGALRLGVGLGFSPCNHVSLNFDYVHVFGRRINFRPTDETIILTTIIAPEETLILPLNIANIVGETSINTERNEFIFSINFHF